MSSCAPTIIPGVTGRLAALLIGALAAAGALTPAVAAAPADARAQGYAALLPGGSQGGVAAAGGDERSAAVGGLRPAGGGLIGSARVGLATSAGALVGTASGIVEASDVTLLDGRVTIASLRMAATVSARPGGARAALTDASARGVTVDGRPVAAGPGARVDVAGIGTLVFFEQVDDGTGGLRANALRLEVSDPAAARLIGEPFVIGHLALRAAPGDSAAPPATAPSGPAAPAPRDAPPRPRVAPAPPPATAAPEAPPEPAPPPALGLPRRPAPSITPRTAAGYVFPVFGEVSYVDDYGAPRAGTGWHRGNDIFAPAGTPVLAVADGTLSRVGVNTLGGNRLWLTDDRGNEFYYAHLSAYAPASVEGARVRAGQVIGFVGNTGQAITTPPHLHFEIHPGGGDSVNPYPYLLAWERGAESLPEAFRQAAVSPDPAPAAGVLLVGVTPERDAPADAGDGLAVPAT